MHILSLVSRRPLQCHLLRLMDDMLCLEEVFPREDDSPDGVHHLSTMQPPVEEVGQLQLMKPKKKRFRYKFSEKLQKLYIPTFLNKYLRVELI